MYRESWISSEDAQKVYEHLLAAGDCLYALQGQQQNDDVLLIDDVCVGKEEQGLEWITRVRF